MFHMTVVGMYVVREAKRITELQRDGKLHEWRAEQLFALISCVRHCQAPQGETSRLKLTFALFLFSGKTLFTVVLVVRTHLLLNPTVSVSVLNKVVCQTCG